MPGRMKTAPSVAARYDLGRQRGSIASATDADGAPVGLCVVAGALHCYDTSGACRWQAHPAGLNYASIVAARDLDGDGHVEILLQAGRPAEPYGAAVLVALEDGGILWRYDVEPMSYQWYLYARDLLHDTPGEEVAVVMMGYPPDKDNGYIALFAFGEDGDAELPLAQRWRYDFSEYTCFPSLLESDLDGDGVDEVVIETHSRLWFLDARTGALKHFAKWDPSPGNVRSYGLIEFVDLNADGRDDFLCIGDFSQHHEVLLNRDGAMKLAWVHGWAENVTTGKVATTWPQPPYADLDGDGGYEIVVSMFNSEGEQTWLVRAYDALTGELEYRVPGVIAVAMADLDGDGRAEIVANASQDPTRTALSGARLLGVADGQLVTLWQDDEATAVPAESVPEERTACASAKPAALHALKGGARFSLDLDGDGKVGRVPWQGPAADPAPDFSKVPEIQGVGFPEMIAADVVGGPEHEVLFFHGGQATVLGWQGGELIGCRRYASTSLPVVADLDGDGSNEIVLSTVQADAEPVFEAVTPRKDDKRLWRTQLPPPGRAGLPQARTSYLRAGRFTGKATPDVYTLAGTPVVRSVALDGRTGAVVWEKGETPDLPRYWAPTINLASAYDFDGDGADDLVFTNPDYYCVASGRTGEALFGPAFPPDIFHQPSQGLYTYPAILAREGEPVVCLVGGHYFQAAMTLRAEPMWYDLPPVGLNRCAFEGFLPLGDGRWLMGFGRQDGQFACVNVNDGTVRWEFALEASASDVAAGDVDGDGRPEFVFGTSHGALYALGDGDDGPRLVWKVDAGSGLGAPILADVNGDGVCEIIAASVEGYVNVFAAD